uniref:Uncharacterized protein n=1 Tax=Achromobacter denitrificans TaxID=32002 RepID=Q6QHQ2_ACHDE|nr:unknown [Achromobacter denitrificans]
MRARMNLIFVEAREVFIVDSCIHGFFEEKGYEHAHGFLLFSALVAHAGSRDIEESHHPSRACKVAYVTLALRAAAMLPARSGRRRERVRLSPCRTPARNSPSRQSDWRRELPQRARCRLSVGRCHFQKAVVQRTVTVAYGRKSGRGPTFFTGSLSNCRVPAGRKRGAGAAFALSRACCNAAKMRGTCSNSSLPARVIRVLRVVRTNSCTPRSSSSSLMARDSGDCSMCSRSAARAKWSSSATARKQRRWRSSMATLVMRHAK